MEEKSRRILLDFDGTCVTNENYPGVGKDIGAVPVLKELIDQGNHLILWTRREGFALDNAVKWFKENDLKLSDINPKSAVKTEFDFIIDDKALNIPLTKSKGKLPYVNWTQVKGILKSKKLI